MLSDYFGKQFTEYLTAMPLEWYYAIFCRLLYAREFGVVGIGGF